MLVTNWGYGMFKNPACDYCDDVVGELGDFSVGDAWLPKYEQDGLGNNIVVIRSTRLMELVQSGIEEHHLKMEKISADNVYESQLGGFRHRREGLAYRLAAKRASNAWTPKKRVKPAWALPIGRPKLMTMRENLLLESYKVYKESLAINSLSYFHEKMKISVSNYEAYQKTFRYRLVSKLQQTLQKFLQ